MTTPKPFDPTKPVQTRDDRQARIICADRKSERYPIVALVTDEEGCETTYYYTKDGSYLMHQIRYLDLINIPKKKEGFLNIYRCGSVALHADKYLADKRSLYDRIACIKITYTEGEGL